MQPLTIEETQKLLNLVWLIQLGPEQGIQDVAAWELRKLEFKTFLKEKGYDFSFPYGA